MDKSHEQASGQTTGSERERLLAELAENRLFQRMAETSPNALYVYDFETSHMIYISARSEQVIGYTAAQVMELGDRFAVTLWHPDDVSSLPAYRRKLYALADDEIAEFEYRIRQPDGAYRWLLSRAAVFARTDTGQVRQIVGVAQDITAHKCTEEALHRSEERFRRYFELGLIGIAITSPTQGILEVNDEICRILGYERSKLLQMTWEEITHPGDLAADGAQFNRVMAGEIDGYAIDKRWIRKDGQVIDTTISVKCLRRADGTVDYFVALLQDITARKRAELSQRQLAAIVESSDDAIISKDLAGVILSWNAGAERLYGYTAPEVLGRSIGLIFPPERQDELVQILEQIKQGEHIEHYETERVCKDGSRLPISLSISPIHNAAGQVMAVSTIAHDITERQQAERELLALKDRLAADLTAMMHLHQLSVRFMTTTEFQALLEETLDTTIAFQRANFGNIQLYNQETSALEIVAQRGFNQAFLDYFSHVQDDHAACGRAMQQGNRVIIEDVETDPGFAPHRAIAAETGFRAVQSTPLFDRAGNLLGMFSTHFRQPRRPTEHELRLTDLYTRQIADMIAFNLAQEKLHQAHDELEAMVAARTRELAERNAQLQAEIAERRQAEQARQHVLGQLVNVQEEERRRLARELHDSLGQYLTALDLGLKTVQALDGCPDPVAANIQQLRALAQRMDAEVERLAFELRPAALDDLGLRDVLNRHVYAWMVESGIVVDLYTRGLDHERLPETIETTIYRIVQEALTNIRKYAQAVHVTLIVERSRNEVRAIIEDNGCGFDLEAMQRTTSAPHRFGLQGMAERVALCGGRLDIEAAPGMGTTIYVHIPLATE